MLGIAVSGELLVHVRRRVRVRNVLIPKASMYDHRWVADRAAIVVMGGIGSSIELSCRIVSAIDGVGPRAVPRHPRAGLGAFARTSTSMRTRVRVAILHDAADRFRGMTLRNSTPMTHACPT